MASRTAHKEDRKKQSSTLKEKRVAKKAKNAAKAASLTTPAHPPMG